MKVKLNQEQQDFIKELYQAGNKYSEIQAQYLTKYNIKPSPGTICLFSGGVNRTRKTSKVFRKSNLMSLPKHRNHIKIAETITVIRCPHCFSLLKTKE